jgi:hypothetical protein
MFHVYWLTHILRVLLGKESPKSAFKLKTYFQASYYYCKKDRLIETENSSFFEHRVTTFMSTG